MTIKYHLNNLIRPFHAELFDHSVFCLVSWAISLKQKVKIHCFVYISYGRINSFLFGPTQHTLIQLEKKRNLSFLESFLNKTKPFILAITFVTSVDWWICTTCHTVQTRIHCSASPRSRRQNLWKVNGVRATIHYIIMRGKGFRTIWSNPCISRWRL